MSEIERRTAELEDLEDVRADLLANHGPRPRPGTAEEIAWNEDELAIGRLNSKINTCKSQINHVHGRAGGGRIYIDPIVEEEREQRRRQSEFVRASMIDGAKPA